MKAFQDSFYKVIKEFSIEFMESHSIPFSRTLDVFDEVIPVAIKGAYTLTGESSLAFHTALKNCMVGRKDIAEVLNRERRREGKDFLKPDNVRDNLHYARNKNRKYLEEEKPKIYQKYLDIEDAKICQTS